MPVLGRQWRAQSRWQGRRPEARVTSRGRCVEPRPRPPSSARTGRPAFLVCLLLVILGDPGQGPKSAGAPISFRLSMVLRVATEYPELSPHRRPARERDITWRVCGSTNLQLKSSQHEGRIGRRGRGRTRSAVRVTRAEHFCEEYSRSRGDGRLSQCPARGKIGLGPH